VKAAAVVFIAAAAFLGAVQFGRIDVGSRPRAPQPMELAKLVAAREARSSSSAHHAEIPRHVESGRVVDYRNVGRPR
jgi:hypothetical protein